ncbi:MAG: hypothetical protein Q9169_005793, partial [Polycauliona sp. 2 TL-2023]
LSDVAFGVGVVLVFGLLILEAMGLRGKVLVKREEIVEGEVRKEKGGDDEEMVRGKGGGRAPTMNAAT